MDTNMQNIACLGKTKFICNKQQLSNIWGSIHQKIKQHWGWVENNALITNKACIAYSVNRLMTNVPHHLETSKLICIANELTGFYMMGKLGR